MATRQQLNPSAVIRAALWLGVLAFGAVIWFVHQRGLFPTKPQPAAMMAAQAALCVLAVVIAFARRGRAISAPDLPTRATSTIQLWAIGEGAALFGGVIFLLSGDAQWYGLGLLSMLTVFVLVPLPRQS